MGILDKFLTEQNSEKNELVCQFNADGILTYVNEAYCKYFNKKAEELLGRSFFELIPVSQHDTVRKYLKGLTLENPMSTIEHTVLMPDGQIGWQQWRDRVFLDKECNLIYESVGKDITERKRFEQAMEFANIELEKLITERTEQLVTANLELREREAQLSRIYSNMRDVITEIDENSIIKYVSPSQEQVFGYKAEQLSGASFLSFVHPEDLEKVKLAFKELITKASEKTLECRVRHVNGSYVWLETIGKPLIGSEGKYVGVIVVSRSIDQRKQVENEMQKTRQRLAHLEKVATIGIMAAGIAHEINQPLNSIKVTADSMLYWHKKNCLQDYAAMIENIQKISEQANRINNVVKNISALAQQEKCEQSLCDINHSVIKACELLSNQLIVNEIELKKELDQELPSVFGNELVLEQIIINLITNAIQALCSTDKSCKRIIIKTKTRKNKIILDVIDNGIGISGALKDTVFDPFVTTKSRNQGMGLGLTIVKEFVKAHHGEIKLLKNPHGGAAFRIRFLAARYLGVG